MQKASRHPANSMLRKRPDSPQSFDLQTCLVHFQRLNWRGSDTLYAWGCRYYFTPLAGVLFTFPSRYSFTIGCQGVFSLIRWSGRIHAEFHVHRITWDPSRGIKNFAHPALTVSGRFFQIVKLAFHPPTSRSRQPRKYKYSRFRLFRFRSPLLTESQSFSFPGVTEMFQIGR